MEIIQAPVQEKIVDRFEKLVLAEKLAHAYLFIGPRGVGKKETAIEIAQRLCSEIDTHIFEVEPGETIKIETVRELLGQIKLRPFNSDKKVFIIKNIDALTIEASNSLLKTLEEPSKDSLLLLTTSAPEKILDTIQSRCHHVYFAHYIPSEAEAQLIQENHLDKHEAHFLSLFTGGNVLLAQQYMEEGFIATKNVWIDEYLSGHHTDQFIKTELKEKETQKIFLDVLLVWVRDAMLLKCHVEDGRLVHQDRMEDLEDFSNQFDFHQMNEMYMKIIRTQKLLSDNLNIKMSLLILRELLHG